MTSLLPAPTRRQTPPSFRTRNTSPLALLATLLAPLALPAQELRPVAAPHVEHVLYDALRGRVVAHGRDGVQAEWDGAGWRPAANARPVPARGGYVDPVNGRTYLVTPPSPWTSQLYTVDVRDGDAWSSFTPNNAPPPRDDVGYAYDEARQQLVMFGGWTATPVDETWTFDGDDWTQRAPTNAPAPRHAPAMAYDAARQRVVLFGGASTTGSFDDTWEWDGSDWTAVPTAQQPGARLAARMTYDAGRQVVVLVGGLTPNGNSDECWEYDGQNWTQVPSAPAVFATGIIRGAAYHAPSGETLVIGARDPLAATGDVYAWDGATWTQRPDLGQPHAVAPEAALTSNPFGAGQLVYGGTSPVTGAPTVSNELWGFDGVDWTLLDGAGPTLTQPALCTLNGAVFLFGTNPATAATETWQWNGATWTQVLGPQPTGAFSDRAVAVDTGAGVARRGFDWTFDGTSWQQAATPFDPPYDVVDYCMAYDPARDVTVAYGGEAWQGGQFPGPGPLPLSPLWIVYEFDGQQWTWSAQGTRPSNTIGAMAFDSRLGALVFAGGQFGAELWRYDGAWTPIDAAAMLGSDVDYLDVLATTDAGGDAAFVNANGALELVLSPAETEVYGAGCGAPTPVLGSDSRASVGNADFTLELVAAPANAAVAVAGATSQAAVPLLGCTLLVAPGEATWFDVTSPTGTAALPVPIPNATSLVGAELFFQPAAVLPAPTFSFTLGRGLRVRIGD